MENFAYPLIPLKTSAFKKAIQYEINNKYVIENAVKTWGKPYISYEMPWVTKPFSKQFRNTYVGQFDKNNGSIPAEFVNDLV